MRVLPLGAWLLFLGGFAFPSAWSAGFPFHEPVQPPRAFQVMVHRGQARQAPENTRPALAHCIDDALEWAEVDVRLTRDGHHILAHDARLTDGRRTLVVAESALEELKSLDIGSGFAARFRGEPPLALSEALALSRGRLNLYLDAKQVDPERLARDILEAGMEKQVVVYDSTENLRRVHTASAGRVALMTKWRPGQPPASWATTYHLAAVEIDADQISPDVVQAFHAVGVKVQTKNLDDWDTPAFWDRALNAGVDWIQTDLPEELIAHALWKQNRKRPVRFSLHRGASRYAPENTLPAFDKAIRLGADFVEFDVRSSRDGLFYLLHDGTLDRTTDGSGPISGTSSDRIQSLSAGVKFGHPYAKLPIPSLDAFLTAVAGRIDLYFDAKAIPPETLVDALKRHGLTERTVVYQSPAYLARLKAIEPRLRLLPPLGEARELEPLASSLKPYAVDADWNILSRELISRCHALGVQVFSDALGSHERIEDYLQAIDWGIDVIQTDHPLRLLRALELRNKPPKR